MNTKWSVYLLLLSVCCSAFGQEEVHINLDMRHSVGGVDSFERKKWMTVHSSNYEGAWAGELDKMAYLLNDLDVYLTRETGTVTQEVSNRTATGIINNASSFKAQYGTLTDVHQYESKQNLIVANQHRIYEEMSADQAGERSAAFMNNYFGTGGTGGMPAPEYFELLNEPLYPLHDFGDQTIEQIFDYHIVMAQKIKELSPNTKVGGYVGAFSIFEEDDFGRWEERWKTYIDDVGDYMDFYSWHLYDFPGINNGIEQFRKGANNEATFDMMEHYSWLVDKERPFVISEYGSQLHDWYEQNWTSYRDWLFIKATNSMLMGFLERPDKIAVTLPFTVIKAQWGYGALQQGQDRPYPWRMMRQETEPDNYTVSGYTGDWVWTEYIKFYELWRDVNGTRVDTKSDNINLLTDAYVEGNQVYFVVNSLIPDTIDFQPDIKGLGNNSISSLTVRNLYFDETLDQTVLAEELETFDADASYQLYPEATMIFVYTLQENMAIDQTSEETKYYATTYLQPIEANQPISFSIENVALDDQGEAVLRIGVGRDLGQSLQPTVTVNDQQLELPIQYRGDNQEERPRFFGVLEVEVPYDILDATNTIEITFPDGGGHVSSLAMQVYNFSRPVTRTAIEGFGILNNEVTIAPGKTRKLLASFSPTGVTNRKIAWSSGDETIATVDEDGVVLAVAVGTTSITAVTDGTDEQGNTFTASATVTVQDSFTLLVDSILFDQSREVVTVGDSATLMPIIFPAEADNQNIVWSSSDASIVSVDATGEVKGVAVGTATIAAAAQDGSDVVGSILVEVVEPAFIQFQNTGSILQSDFKIGETLEVSFTYSAGNGETVNPSGIKFWLREITEGFGAVVNDYTVELSEFAGTRSGSGSAAITLTDNITTTEDLPDGNFYFLFLSFNNTNGDFIENGLFPINIVGPDLTGISLSEESLTMIEKETATIAVSFNPANASNRSVIWSSSDVNVATVDEGIITAVGAGSAVITATASTNDDISTSVSVSVEELVVLQSISLIPDEITVAPGESLQLEVVYNPGETTYKGVSWSSGNPQVATVDEAGLLTGVSEGSALINVVPDRYPSISVGVFARVMEPLSVKDGIEIKIYPNPTKQYLSISGMGITDYSVSILDLSGRLVRRFEQQKEGQISLVGINPGVYQVLVQTEGQERSFRLILE